MSEREPENARGAIGFAEDWAGILFIADPPPERDEFIKRLILLTYAAGSVMAALNDGEEGQLFIDRFTELVIAGLPARELDR